MSVLCCITCVCITECALYAAPLIQKVFPYKSPLHTIYSKILQKTSEVFFSFMFFFFLNMVTSAAVQASITTNMSMNNHYFNRSYSKALQLQKT